MVIEQNRVVSIDYILKDKDGNIIDRSEGQPLSYLHGNQNLIPGLEKELQGKKAGDSLECKIQPEDGYGQRDESLVFEVNSSDFAEPDKVQIGMQFQAQQPDGFHVVTVVGISDGKIKVDANHPLAGQELHFSVTVREVREASPEELDHGHTHGGCDCDGCGDDDDYGCGGCSGCGDH